MSDFLKRLSRDPYAPIDGASVVSVDERGNGYDYRGQLIAPKFEQPQQTWGETALGVATAPARLATALAGSLSPYGSEGWQVPPIAQEGWDALTAVGDAYTGKMAPADINSRALGMAGFMMGGGGLAAKPTVAAESAGARLSRSAFERSQEPINAIYPTLDRLNRAVAEDDLRTRWAQAFPESPIWEEIQPDWWLNNRNMDNAASRQIGGDGDLWLAMNRAGNVTPNAGFSNDLMPMSTATDLPGVASLKGAERLATPQGINLDYLDILNSVGPGRSTLHSNSDSRPALLAGALGQEGQPIRAYHGASSPYAGETYNPKKSQYKAFFAAEDPEYASRFARPTAEAPRVYPVDISPDAKLFDYQNPNDTARLAQAVASNPAILANRYLVGPDTIQKWVRDGDAGILEDAGVQKWLRKQGYDGWKFEDTAGLGDNRTSYGMLKPGHVRSATTGEILFSNADSSPALLAGGQDQTEEGYADGGRVGDLPRPYSIARSMVGQREGRGNDLLNRFLNGDTAGMTSAEYAWCSRFVKQAAAKAGVDVSGATDMARSWLKVGQPVDKPAVGDVVVLSRGNPNSQYGHVGFYEGTDANGNVRILSGNHNNAVASGSYPASRVLGYRRLEGQPEAYDPATGQQGLKPLAMMDGVGREVPALPAPTPEPSQVADQPKPSFGLTKLASLFVEPEQAQAPQVNFTPIQAFQPQGSPIQASTPYRGTFADGGQVRGLPDQSEPIHAGPLHSTVPGRTDHLPITVAAGSFVLPADVVSGLGEGNTNAGMQAVSEMFPLPPVRRSDGGRVPIAAAGGEYVIAPETVAALGGGDLGAGHELLDDFVLRTRANTIQRLRALPSPEK